MPLAPLPTHGAVTCTAVIAKIRLPFSGGRCAAQSGDPSHLLSSEVNLCNFSAGFVIALLLLPLDTTSALTCYEGVGDSNHATDCDSVCLAGVGCSCFKIPDLEGSVIRGCRANPHNGVSPGCGHVAYYHDSRNEVEMCYCNGDLCNGASKLGGMLAAVIGFAVMLVANLFNTGGI